MSVPIKYRNYSEQAIASYDYIDLANGSGIETFYGFVQRYGFQIGITEYRKYSLQNEPTLSEINETTLTKTLSIGQAFDSDNYKNFDFTPFNLPRIIKGKATVLVTCTMSSTYVLGMRVNAELYKYDGSETLIGLSSIYFEGSLGITTIIYEIDCTETAFKVGDALRLKIKGDSNNSANNGNVVTLKFAHCPLNFDTTTFTPSTNENITSQLILKCPFKIIDL